MNPAKYVTVIPNDGTKLVTCDLLAGNLGCQFIRIHAEGPIPATRFDFDRWMKTFPQPWTAAMEATVLTGWIYDHMKRHAKFASGAPLALHGVLHGLRYRRLLHFYYNLVLLLVDRKLRQK